MTYSKQKNTFQFGLVVLLFLGLAAGVILATGNASLIFSPNAQITIDYGCTGSGTKCMNDAAYMCLNGVWTLTYDCNKNGTTCVPPNGSNPTASCDDVVTYACEQNALVEYRNGVRKVVQQCGLKTCAANVSNLKNGCYYKSQLTVTLCSNGTILSCLLGQNMSCSVKSECQISCTPSDYQVTGEIYGAAAKCIYTTYHGIKCNSDSSKILECNGTYCTTVKENCESQGKICLDGNGGVRCGYPN